MRPYPLAVMLTLLFALLWHAPRVGAAERAGDESRPLVAFLTLDGALASRSEPARALLDDDAPPAILAVVDSIRAVAGDPRVSGLVIQLKYPTLLSTDVEELSEAVAFVRGAGKPVHVFSYSYGPAELGLAASADRVLLQSGGEVSLPGAHMEEMFFADALAWAGVKADFVQIGDYKGASESLVNSRPSPQWDQNINALLDSLYAAARERLKRGRGLDDSALDAAMSSCFYADADAAIKAHLVDEDLDRMELDSLMERTFGRNFDWTDDIAETIRASGRRDLKSMGLFEAFAQVARLLGGDEGPRTARETIAVLHIDAEIVDGESGSGGLLGGGPAVGGSTIRQALADIEDDPHIKGLIVRVDSPGGSAVASELMWRGIRRVAQKMPVFTSVGSMAASGGYYVAVAGERIFVSPSSIVGSIGVVGGKLAMGGLYEKLKINVVERSRGPLGGIEGSLRPWTDRERDLVRRQMKQTYDLFASRVVAGRAGIDLAKVGAGRLFAGRDAVTLKMADEIGGLAVAVDRMAERLGLAPGTYDTVDYPAPLTLGDVLRESVGAGMVTSPAPAGASAIRAAAVEVFGERAWRQLRSQVGALLQLRRSPVVLASPRVFVVR